jgi:hypothetical protein
MDITKQSFTHRARLGPLAGVDRFRIFKVTNNAPSLVVIDVSRADVTMDPAAGTQ